MRPGPDSPGQTWAPRRRTWRAAPSPSCRTAAEHRAQLALLMHCCFPALFANVGAQFLQQLVVGRDRDAPDRGAAGARE